MKTDKTPFDELRRRLEIMQDDLSFGIKPIRHVGELERLKYLINKAIKQIEKEAAIEAIKWRDKNHQIIFQDAKDVKEFQQNPYEKIYTEFCKYKEMERRKENERA